jgi:hypothetical protein
MLGACRSEAARRDGHPRREARSLDTEVVRRPGALLTPTWVYSYRSTTRRREGKGDVCGWPWNRRLLNGRTEPWKAVGAALVGPKGEAPRVLGAAPQRVGPGVGAGGGGATGSISTSRARNSSSSVTMNEARTWVPSVYISRLTGCSFWVTRVRASVLSS